LQQVASRKKDQKLNFLLNKGNDMNEQTQAEQFTHEIDNLLNPKTAANAPGIPTNPELDVAQMLAAADFSAESQVRQSLKQKLLNPPNGEKERLMNTPLTQRPYIRLALAGLLIAFFLLAVSPFGATLAQSLVNVVKSWQVGENTTAVSVEGDFEAVKGEDGSTIIQAAPEAPEPIEEISEGQEPVAFDNAQGNLAFTLRQPTFIPDGFVPQGVVWINEGQASVEYINESEFGFFGLLQTAVGGENGDVQVSFTSDVDVTDVTVNGRDAIWADAGEEGSLIWEAEGVTYQLNGLGDLDLALRIAESVQ
jgi:hypothetical protein